MKTTIISIIVALTGLHSIVAEDQILLNRVKPWDSSPSALAAAKERGIAAAKEDIKTGKGRIFYYGIPRLDGIDKETGQLVQVIAVNSITEVFAVEAEAYNRTMLDWHRNPIIVSALSTNRSASVLEEAKKRGQSTAAKDIQAGRLRILYGGPPGLPVKAPMDQETGYPLLKVKGDIVTEEFIVEMKGYNQAMREWHAKTKLK